VIEIKVQGSESLAEAKERRESPIICYSAIEEIDNEGRGPKSLAEATGRKEPQLAKSGTLFVSLSLGRCFKARISTLFSPLDCSE
jgi:hypothetical protein